MERRFAPTRARVENRRLEGVSAVYYRAGDPSTEFSLYEDMTERIRPGAFDQALSSDRDVVCLFNHDTSQLLGRRSSGTLKLASSEEGLEFSVELGKTTVAADVREHVERGDVAGCSFAFIPRGVKYEERADGSFVRWIEDAELLDVGPVTEPAYAGTSVAARGAQASESHDELVAEARKDVSRRSALERIRSLEADGKIPSA